MVTSDVVEHKPGKGTERAGGVEWVTMWTFILVADGARLGSFSSKQAGRSSEKADSVLTGEMRGASPNTRRGAQGLEEAHGWVTLPSTLGQCGAWGCSQGPPRMVGVGTAGSRWPSPDGRVSWCHSCPGEAEGSLLDAVRVTGRPRGRNSGAGYTFLT